jgi:hypothetical protein
VRDSLTLTKDNTLNFLEVPRLWRAPQELPKHLFGVVQCRVLVSRVEASIGLHPGDSDEQRQAFASSSKQQSKPLEKQICVLRTETLANFDPRFLVFAASANSMTFSGVRSPAKCWEQSSSLILYALSSSSI